MTEFSSVSGLRGVREQRDELLRVLKAALKQTNCDGDLCLYEWHDAARRAIGEVEEAALSLPPSPQAATCGVIGYPEQGRQVCELLAGHEGYHRQDGVRWLGCWKPWDATPQAPAGAQGQVQGVQALTASEVKTIIQSFTTSTNPHFDWKEHWEKVTDGLNMVLRGKREAAADVSSQAGQPSELSRHTCDSCGQDLRGAGFDGHYNIYCHKPQCAKHLIPESTLTAEQLRHPPYPPPSARHPSIEPADADLAGSVTIGVSDIHKLEAKWEQYIDVLSAGTSKLVHVDTAELAQLQIEMAGRFLQDLHTLLYQRAAQ